jgi:hypothetical protein
MERTARRRPRLHILIPLAAVMALTGCAQAQSAADRAEKEAFCLKWRAVKEVTSRADSPAALRALDKARSGLRGAVPEQQRTQLDRVLTAARAYAEAVRDGGGTLDDQALTAAREQAGKGYDRAVAGLNSYCAGSLTG